MIKGFRFTNQLANAEVDARIHQEFLNKNDGVFYGMELSHTNNSITVSEGLCEIAGRPIAVIDNETVAVSTESLYCLLILEIDLAKESTKDTFRQASFKLLTSNVNYPTVTQQDINVYNGSNNLYQLEFARFKSGSNGISEFKDTRVFLNFDGIYSQIKSECQTIIKQIKQELASVEDGSAYVLKNNLVTIIGTITMPEANSSLLSGTVDIDYPDTFNNNNCIVISLMSHNTMHTDWWSTVSNSKNSSSMLIGSGDLCARLKSDKITVSANKVANEEDRKDITFKITLMKLPKLIEGTDYILGDLNGDSKIDNKDFELIKNYLQGKVALTEKQFKAADINKDGKIDAMDSYKLQQYIANGTPFE